MKVAIMGYGTIGSGVAEILRDNRDIIARRAGVPLELKYVLDLRDFEGDPVADKIVHDYKTIAEDKEVEMVVETMGGVEPAYTFVRAMLEAGKHVTTSNKALVADKGAELIRIARENKVNFMFEASVGGGIPIIRPLNQCLTGDVIEEITGIVNGTTNYMLSKMSNEHLDYDEVLKEAQAKGYAESDPTADVGGLDAARKVVILASIAFNTRISLKDVLVEGIENIEACDIKYAQSLGYAVKLLGIAKNDPENGITVCVKPTMLPLTHPLAGVNGVYNAVFVNGDAIGEAMFLGMGAGRLPTASSVVGDIIEIARDIQSGSTGRISCTCFKEKKLCPPEKMSAPAYIRLQVLDQPGALAAIAAAFGAQNVSLRNVIQQNAAKGQKAEIVVITHSVSESNLQMALQILRVLPVVEKVSCVIRVEDSSLA